LVRRNEDYGDLAIAAIGLPWPVAMVASVAGAIVAFLGGASILAVIAGVAVCLLIAIALGVVGTVLLIETCSVLGILTPIDWLPSMLWLAEVVVLRGLVLASIVVAVANALSG
jgi:hypothetical protein